VSASNTSVRPVTSLSSFAKHPLVLALYCGTGVASAQNPPDEHATTLDTVEVTEAAPYQAHQASSPKFTAPLRDTPQTVIVIPKQLIEDRGLSSLADVLRTTPGITLGAGEGGTPTGDRPFVRGYEASNDMTIDGIRDFARGYHETFNLEAVEILKGPSSAYGGRGGTGGGINMQTKTPKANTFTEVKLGYGTDDQWSTTVDSNLAINERLAARLNLMKMGGHTPGRDYVGIDRTGIAPSITYGLGTPTRVTLQYSLVKNEDTPDQGFPFSSDAHPEIKRPVKLNRKTFYGRRHVDFRDAWSKQSTLLFEHDFNQDLHIRNITRHTETLNHYFMGRPTFPGTNNNPVTGQCPVNSPKPECDPNSPDAVYVSGTRSRWRGSEGVVNQTDLSGTLTTGFITHNFTTGLEYARDRLYNRSMAVTPITAISSERDSLRNPQVPNKKYNYSFTYGEKIRSAEIENRSIYVFDTMELNEQFLVNAGLRFENYKVTDPVRFLQRKDDLFNYQVGLVWKPLTNGSVYLNYSTSSNPAGENIDQGGGADGAMGATGLNNDRDQLKPEKTRSIELGTKWDVLNENLSLTAALFETKKTDARSNDPATAITTLDGSNRVRGIELGVGGAITSKWDIWAGYTYMDHEMTHYLTGGRKADPNATPPVTYLPPTDLSGNHMKFIPKHSASLWNTYKLLSQLSIGGGATFMGMRYADDANKYELPSYIRYDLMAKYDVTDNFYLQLNANNLANTRLYDSSHVGMFYNVGPGRSYMLTLNYRFD